jgi:DNA replication protein DnaC
LPERDRRGHPEAEQLEVWSQDEARVGQKGRTGYVWWQRGHTPRGRRDVGYQSAWIIGAVCPARDTGVALVLTRLDTEAMNLFLAELSQAVSPGAHGVVLMDKAGWHTAVVEDVNLHAPRGLDRALFHKLATCQWVRDHHHLVVVGPTGIGKSWLACALGHKACREGFSVLYKRAGRLFGDLSQARGEGRLPRLLTTLERVRLLIIDDWGPEPLNAEQRRDLLEIVDDRYDRGSLLITSQVPISRWHEVIGDPTLADATLDRIVHRAHRIELKGPSLRRHLVAAESPAA